MELSDLDFLEKIDWIQKNEPLWWNFNYPKDERDFMPDFKDFENQLIDVGKRDGFEYKIYPGWNVPITLLPLNIEKKQITLFISARPYTPKEISYMGDFRNALEDLAKEVKTEKEKRFPSVGYSDYFFPHIRGFAKEVKDNVLFYYPYGLGDPFPWYKSKYDSNVLIKKALEKEGINFLKDFIIGRRGMMYGLSLWDKAKKASKPCAKEDKIHYRNSWSGKNIKFEWITLPESFRQVEYNEFKKSKESLVSYYPVVMEEVNESVPFALCNNVYGKRDLFNLGIYWGNNCFIPHKDEEFTKESSKKISQILNKKINSIIFYKQKGSYHYKILK